MDNQHTSDPDQSLINLPLQSSEERFQTMKFIEQTAIELIRKHVVGGEDFKPPSWVIAAVVEALGPQALSEVHLANYAKAFDRKNDYIVELEGRLKLINAAAARGLRAIKAGPKQSQFVTIMELSK